MFPFICPVLIARGLGGLDLLELAKKCLEPKWLRTVIPSDVIGKCFVLSHSLRTF